MVTAFLGTWGSPKKSLAASTRVTLSRYTARVRVYLADLQGPWLFYPSCVQLIRSPMTMRRRSECIIGRPNTIAATCLHPPDHTSLSYLDDLPSLNNTLECLTQTH